MNSFHQLICWLRTTGAVRLTQSCLLVAWMLLVPRMEAQNFAIDRHVISGGGGVSTNAQFSVSGTLGQPEAGGTMSGGGYSLAGGFWSMFAVVQTTGAPLLQMARQQNNFVITWPQGGGTFTLESTTNLAVSASWSSNGVPVVLSNGVNTVTVPAAPGFRFYRLRGGGAGL